MPFAVHAGAENFRWDPPPPIPNISVLNQDGERIWFYSDLIEGKSVVINFIFTNCKTVCPVLTAVLRETQLMLADEIALNTQFISISVDPTNDQPENLKQYAEKFEVGPGWVFVTGSKPDIDRLLSSLGVFSKNKDDHQPVILIGNEKAGIWTRRYGSVSPSTLITLINEATLQRNVGTTKEINAFSGE